mgnify:CR=1 FL=1
MFLGEDPDCDCVELFACVGEGEFWFPMKERDTVVLFQTLDVLTQVLLGDVELLGRVRDVKLFCKLYEIIEAQ